MITPQPATDIKHSSPATLKKTFHPLRDKGVLARVNLGSPSKNCLGVGICKIDLLSLIDQDATSLSPCSSIAILKKHEEDRLSIHFKIGSLSSNVKEAHFHGDTFIVEENYILPKAVVQLVGCRPTIFSGFYQVDKSKDSFIVYF